MSEVQAARTRQDIDAERLLADLKALRAIGGRPDGGLDRLAFTPADLEGRRWYASRLRDAGLDTWTDPALNVFGRMPGSRGPWLLAGSHLDTVPAGGWLDGAYGAVAALEVLRSLHEARDPAADRLEVVGFSDEEGVRFGGGIFGSQALCGELDLESLRTGRDWKGNPIEYLLQEAGVEPRRLSEAASHLSEVFAYLELHIEQGPRMEAAGIDLTVVEGIVGIHRHRLTVTGEQNHAGTTPFGRRRDAGRVAARAAGTFREVALGIDRGVVGNIGSMRFHPGGVNVVPGRAEFDLEVRHPDEAVIESVVKAFIDRVREIAAEDGCSLGVEARSQVPPAPMDHGLMATVERACVSLGHSTKRLWSYAGHDASVLSGHAPAAMIFVPSRQGISHAPGEDTDEEHLVLGARALLRSIKAVLADGSRVTGGGAGASGNLSD